MEYISPIIDDHRRASATLRPEEVVAPRRGADEGARLGALRSYRVLDTPEEKRFDDIVKLAAMVCGAPMAVVSLVDEHRQWFKARLGVAATETPRDISFCTHTILGGEVMVIPDAAEDPRFARSPLVVGAPHIRFYAGAPLVDERGLAMGALCVMDEAPRGGLRGEQLRTLELLASQVVEQLRLTATLSQVEAMRADRDKAGGAQRELEARLAVMFDAAPAGRMFVTLGGHIERANPAACELLDAEDEDELAGLSLTDNLVHPQDRPGVRAMLAACASGLMAEAAAGCRVRRTDGMSIPVRITVARIGTDAAPSGLYLQVQELGASAHQARGSSW